MVKKTRTREGPGFEPELVAKPHFYGGFHSPGKKDVLKNKSIRQGELFVNISKKKNSCFHSSSSSFLQKDEEGIYSTGFCYFFLSISRASKWVGGDGDTTKPHRGGYINNSNCILPTTRGPVAEWSRCPSHPDHRTPDPWAARSNRESPRFDSRGCRKIPSEGFS